MALRYAVVPVPLYFCQQPIWRTLFHSDSQLSLTVFRLPYKMFLFKRMFVTMILSKIGPKLHPCYFCTTFNVGNQNFPYCAWNTNLGTANKFMMKQYHNYCLLIIMAPRAILAAILNFCTCGHLNIIIWLGIH